MNLEVFYVSYRRDLHWLAYSLQLLFKHLRGSYHVTVHLEENCRDVVSEWRVPVHYIFEKRIWPDGYHWAMSRKALADTYVKGDPIMLLDSDHMLMEPAYVEDFIEDGFPTIRYRDWDEDPNDQSLVVGRAKWGPPTERVLGIPLDRDYMIGPPFVFLRDTFRGMRQRIEEITGLPFADVVRSEVPFDYKRFLDHEMHFCDYEALGLYAAKFQPERYILKHHPRGTHWPFRVYWSWGDWSPGLQAKLDDLLAA
jgi:hypothetical protein